MMSCSALRTRIIRGRDLPIARSATRSAASPVPKPALIWARSVASTHRLENPQWRNIIPSQVETSSDAALLFSLRGPGAIPQTLTEKIVQQHSHGLPKGKYVKSGDYVSLQPQHCMTHDNSWPVALKFMSIGASTIRNQQQIVMTLDHDVQNTSESNIKKYQQIEQFAKSQGVDFYPAGRGIGHQIMVEEGYTFPGSMVVASDSHTNMYGGVACLGTPVVRTDAASIWATGKTWWQIPPIAKVSFRGTLPNGVTGKDVIVALCGLFSKDEVLNHAIEFGGSEESMKSLKVDDRLTIANMTTEWGALSGLFPVDQVLRGWLRSKATEAAMYERASLAEGTTHLRFTHERIDHLLANPLFADPGARYAKELFLDLSSLSPYVSGPNSVKIATPLHELATQDIKINRAYLVSCTNSRASDLAAAAKVFKDAAENNGGQMPRIADGVSFYIAAASMPEQRAAEEAGDWQAMLEAGAQPLPAGCGPCIGLGTGLLEPGEVGISASNRNFKGRMGSTEAKAYLASPAVVAASALAGKISGPGDYSRPVAWAGVVLGEGDGIKEEDRMLTADEAMEKVIGQLDDLVATAEKEIHGGKTHGTGKDAMESTVVDILPGFPERISGEIIFCDADNINTDGIYPGKMTYQDDVTPNAMAAACMQNYDPKFASTARVGDILVSGFNFGCGSSREQAATAILAKEIPLVVAGSFGNIFARNSINNALMGLELPRLVARLRAHFPTRQDITGGTTSSLTEPEGNRESLDAVKSGPMTSKAKLLTRRTGWTLVWDVRRSRVEITEGKNGETWTQAVGELPANVQEIIASGGLEAWVKAELQEGQK